MKIIDLRSDTVTRPCKAMRQTMSEAEVGDDVYGDDPTVNRLEEMAADMLGFEKALFTSSGTQANLIAIMSHCGRGDEYIVGQQAHTYKYEGGGAAVLGSIQPQPIEFEDDSTLDLKKVAEKIKPDDFHFAQTRLLCLENTQNGNVLPVDYLKNARLFCNEHALRLHLDGARLFNGVVKQEINPKEITENFDSVSICLSKGLGAPVGSILCGTDKFIQKARKWRKMTGGGMRQAGILAAAGIFALENNVERLASDHDNAKLLARKLGQFEQIEVSYPTTQTNMVFLKLRPDTATALAKEFEENNILITPGPTTRLVTHLDISQEDIEFTINVVSRFFNQTA